MVFQWVRYRADLQEGDIKGIFLLKGNAFLGFHVTSASSFFSLRSPFPATLHKKGSQNKVISLKQGSEMSDFSLNRVPVWRSRRPDTSPQTSSVSPFPFPTPIPGANTSKFRQYCFLQGWQISLSGEYSILNQTNVPIWTGYRLDPQAGPRHVRLEKWAAKKRSLLREFAVYRLWTFERVRFSELVACVAEALLSPFSAPFLCRFHAFYEEWRIGVGPKKNVFFFSPFKRRERERARTWKISREQYDEMKAGSRLKMRFSVRFCVFCWPLLL